MQNKKKLLLIAGDTSGDIYGEMLCKSLQDLYPNHFELFSCGGPYLARVTTQKLNLIAHSVSGIVEVFTSLKKFVSLFHRTLVLIESLNPDLIILIDFPDFNLRIAKKLNKRFPLFYYVSPQLWAWRPQRVSLIKKYVDEIIVLFNFEKTWYLQHGVKAHYFGHPLLERIKPDSNHRRKPIISLLPGSRKNEVKKHLPLMLATIPLIQKQLPHYSFQIIKPESLSANIYHISPLTIPLVPHSYQTLAESSFIITSSGTATLEIALLQTPFLVLYKLNYFSWYILRSLVTIKFVAMANIVAGEKVVEEFVQRKADPSLLAHYTIDILADQKKYAAIQQKLGLIYNKLTPLNATKTFAQFIYDYFGSFSNHMK